MQIEEDVINRGGQHPPQTKTEFNNIVLLFIQNVSKF